MDRGRRNKQKISGSPRGKGQISPSAQFLAYQRDVIAVLYTVLLIYIEEGYRCRDGR